MTNQTFILLILLQFKHFVFDWWLQSLKQISGKGSYLELWGVSHSLLHGIWTFILFTLADNQIPLGTAFLVGSLDFLVHYHVDWSKQNLARFLGVTPQDNLFWVLIGIDQLLHQLTYLFLIWGFCGHD